MDRMERDRIAKRVDVGECASTRSVFKEKRFGYQASKENGPRLE